MLQLLSNGIILALSTILIFPVIYSSSASNAWSISGSDLFIFDSLSFYLILLILFLGAYSIFCLNNFIDINTKLFLFISLSFSVLCFCTNHCVLFWCFYELAMLPLLYLIFFDSPYSERFLAGWYFCSYLIFTSLPLILILLYNSFINESFYFSSWSNSSNFWILIVLSFIFFTKVPLVPFHTWLPIVHAEATSVVSIFLSGYIMKLGLLGVFRCCPFLFNGEFLFYVILCCIFSVFFIITASTELDGKRWLAFLSLSHIVVPFLGFYVSDWEGISMSFLFCLGHGLSAGLVFGLLWFFYNNSNTRNWILLKSSVSGKLTMIFLCISLLSLCSFPPTIQFFCEVVLLCNSTTSITFLLFWFFYLFVGGLVPLVLCGHLLVRNECFEVTSSSTHNFFLYLFFLSFWCYLGVLCL